MKTIQPLLLAILMIATVIACNSEPAQPKPFTVGIINANPTMEVMLAGFKAGMTDLGYTEGENPALIRRFECYSYCCRTDFSPFANDINLGFFAYTESESLVSK